MPNATTYVSRPGLTSGRYTPRPDGSVFDTWGGYAISADYLEKLLGEGRADWARHKFAYVDRPPHHDGEGWFRSHVECSRCGETRLIGVSVEQLNRQERFCIPPKSDGLWFAFLVAVLVGFIAVLTFVLMR